MIKNMIIVGLFCGFSMETALFEDRRKGPFFHTGVQTGGVKTLNPQRNLDLHRLSRSRSESSIKPSRLWSGF